MKSGQRSQSTGDQVLGLIFSDNEKWAYCQLDIDTQQIEERTDARSVLVSGSESDAEWDLAVSAQDWLNFRQLISKWHKERGAMSSITRMAMCYSYQRIIAMGPEAIPLILRQLDDEGDEPDMWFWALQVLTGADPVTDDMRGDMTKMARAWLDWASEADAW